MKGQFVAGQTVLLEGTITRVDEGDLQEIKDSDGNRTGKFKGVAHMTIKFNNGSMIETTSAFMPAPPAAVEAAAVEESAPAQADADTGLADEASDDDQ